MGCPNTGSNGNPAFFGKGAAKERSIFKAKRPFQLCGKEYKEGDGVMRNADGFIPDEPGHGAGQISNEVGTLSMANFGEANTGGSQFFINTNHNEFLDYFDERTPSKHPVFGKVVEGLDILKSIESVQTGPGDKPATPVVMESITIE